MYDLRGCCWCNFCLIKMIFFFQRPHSIDYWTWLRQQDLAVFVNSDDISSVGDSKCSRNANREHKPNRMDHNTNDIYMILWGCNASAVHTLTKSNTIHMDSSTDPSTLCSFLFPFTHNETGKNKNEIIDRKRDEFRFSGPTYSVHRL